MLARFGNVIYWTACGLALLLLVGYFRTWPGQTPFYHNEIVLLIGAVVVWLIGRAIKYVFSGR
jgi:hypothetical protein